jgi:hypothetical protein
VAVNVAYQNDGRHPSVNAAQLNAVDELELSDQAAAAAPAAMCSP